MYNIGEIYRINCAYGKLMYGVKNVRGVCEERILMNILCYMFNTICGLFDTISAYRTQGVPILLAIVHLLWVLNCAGRITLACFAASSVVEQVGKSSSKHVSLYSVEKKIAYTVTIL